MTAAQTVTSAIAKRDDSPRALVAQYRDSFAAVVPSHIKPDQWIRVAQGALKKGKVIQVDGRKGTELEIAAGNNPGAFLAALLDAARLGLEPGTEQYYLTPRKVKNRLEILGIVGYQGHIELMYRAGAISSVVAECVYANDSFTFRPGVDERPVHEIDWDAEDRGPLRLAYAYAVMKDGATSKVVVLNRAAINRIKASSQGADSEYSPWRKHEPSMWLKSAVRQLAKWVPTSAEYRREQLRAIQDVAGERGLAIVPPATDSPPATTEPDPIDDVIEGQVVDEYTEAQWAEEVAAT
jgi:recombination protein RecT